MNAGVVFALGAALTWGTASFLAGQACRRGSTLAVLFTTQITGLGTMLVVTAISVLAGDGLDWTAWRLALPFAAVAGLAELLGFAAFYRAMLNGPMGIAAPVAGLGVVVPVVFGLSTGSILGHWQVLGLVLAAVGIVLLGVDRTSIGVRNLGLAVASGVAFGIALVALAQGAALDEVAGGTLMRFTTVPLLALFWWQRRRRRSRQLRNAPRHAAPQHRHRRTPAPSVPVRPGALAVAPPSGRAFTTLPWLVLGAAAGVADALGNLLFGLSSTRMSLSVAALISSMDPIVTALLARFCLAERLPPAGRWGAMAAVIGAALASTS